MEQLVKIIKISWFLLFISTNIKIDQSQVSISQFSYRKNNIQLKYYAFIKIFLFYLRHVLLQNLHRDRHRNLHHDHLRNRLLCPSQDHWSRHGDHHRLHLRDLLRRDLLRRDAVLVNVSLYVHWNIKSILKLKNDVF